MATNCIVALDSHLQKYSELNSTHSSAGQKSYFLALRYSFRYLPREMKTFPFHFRYQLHRPRRCDLLNQSHEELRSWMTRRLTTL